jgi:thymidine phosphorylase
MERSANHLATAPVIRPCLAPRSGYVSAMNAREIGLAVVALGGGRRRATDPIDPRVGLTEIRQLGHQIAAGEPLALVHAADAAAAEAAISALQRAIRFDDRAPAPTKVIHARIDAGTAAQI